MLQRTGTGLLDAISGAGPFRFGGRIERVQDVTGVKLDVVEIPGFGGEPGVQNRHARLVNGDRQKAATAGRVAPVRHHVTDMQMRRNRFDFRDDDGVALPLAGELHGPPGVQREAHRILIRNRDHVAVLIDEHVCRERSDAGEQALAIGLRRRRRFRLMRGAADAL